ncbi:hypothetical protein ACP4OV_005955 [Aristida adscensionis]
MLMELQKHLRIYELSLLQPSLLVFAAGSQRWTIGGINTASSGTTTKALLQPPRRQRQPAALEPWNRIDAGWLCGCARLTVDAVWAKYNLLQPAAGIQSS